MAQTSIQEDSLPGELQREWSFLSFAVRSFYQSWQLMFNVKMAENTSVMLILHLL